MRWRAGPGRSVAGWSHPVDATDPQQDEWKDLRESTADGRTTWWVGSACRDELRDGRGGLLSGARA